MPRTYPSKLVFNRGEVDELVDARFDIEPYRFGCKRLRNFSIHPEGPVSARPGTFLHGELKGSCLLFEFTYSDTTTYLIEAGNNYLRFWNNGQQVTVSSATAWATTTSYVVGDYVDQGGTIYYCQVAHTSGTFATDLGNGNWVAQIILEIPTDYFTNQLLEADVFPIGDFIYISNGSFRFSRLTRTGASSFTFGKVDWTYPPFRTQNVDRSATIYASATTGTGITLTAAGHTFDDSGDLVGGHYELLHKVEGRSEEQNINSTAAAAAVNGTPIRTNGFFSVSTSGFWYGTLELQRSYDGTNYETIKSWDSFSSFNTIFSDNTNDELVYLRTRFTAGGDALGILAGEPFNASGTAPTTVAEATVLLEVDEAFIGGFVEITAVAAGGVTATADVKSELWASGSGNTTIYWAEGAFSDLRGHPRRVNLINGSLVLAGNLEEENAVWHSKTDDFENFKYGTSATDAFKIVTQGKRNPVRWLIENRGKLLIGTAANERQLTGGIETGYSAESVPASLGTSAAGSAAVPASELDDSIVFVKKDKKKIMEYLYSFEKDGYKTQMLNRISRKITGDGITQAITATAPENRWFGVRSDGELAVLTYERSSNVVGWARWYLREGDTILSVAKNPDASTGLDKVYIATKRIIDGVTKYYLESFDLEQWEDENDPRDYHSATYGIDCSHRTSDVKPTAYDINTVQLALITGTSLYGHPGGVPTNSFGYRWIVTTNNVHVFDDGDIIFIEGTGFDQLNGGYYKVYDAGAQEIWLMDVSEEFRIASAANTGAMPANSGADAWSNTQLTFTDNPGVLPRDGIIWGVVGMVELNGQHKFLIEDVAGDTFVDGVDSAAYTAYTSGGILGKAPVLNTAYGTGDLTGDTRAGGKIYQAFGSATQDYLENATVSALIDGVPYHNLTLDANGTLQHPEGGYARAWKFGLPYEMIGETMKLETVLQDGSRRGRTQSVVDIVTSVYKTAGGQVGIDINDMQDIQRVLLSAATDGAPPLLTDDVVVPVDGNAQDGTTVIFQQTDPLPMTIRAFVPKLDTEDQ